MLNHVLHLTSGSLNNRAKKVVLQRLRDGSLSYLILLAGYSILDQQGRAEQAISLSYFNYSDVLSCVTH